MLFFNWNRSLKLHRHRAPDERDVPPESGVFFFVCGGLRKFYGPMSSPLRSVIVLMTWVNCHASRGLIQSTDDALNAGFCRARLSFASTFFSFSLLLLDAVERAVKKCESLIGRIGSSTWLLAIRWSPQFRSSNRPCGARPDVTDADQVSLSRNGLPSFWVM